MTVTLSERDLWLQILERVKLQVKRPHFLTWFQNTTVLSRDKESLVVGVPNVFAKEWLGTKLKNELSEAIKEVDASISDLQFEVDDRLSLPDNVLSVDVMKHFQSEKKVRKLPGRQEVKLGEDLSSKCLNPRYNLQNFVIGQNNRLAHAAALAVSASPGALYNPLFLYGGVGLGKTHLLQAIGNEILKRDPDKIVVYVTSEKFTNEIVDAIGRRSAREFKDRYRKVDCLIVDDVQFLANKDMTQQEFFHTFNELYDNNKQLIISSDRPPKDLHILEDRLVSRFEMGMIVDLQFPDYETRLAILQSKCREYQVLIDPEVLEFIALNVQESVRELVGVLIQAIAQAELEHSTPTVRSVMQVMQKNARTKELQGAEIYRMVPEKSITVSKDVMELVAQHYKVSLEELVGSSRKQEIVIPRQVAMYLTRYELHLPYEKIGEDFGGKNHTTVLHACEQIIQKLRKDKKLLKDVNAIKKAMGL